MYIVLYCVAFYVGMHGMHECLSESMNDRTNPGDWYKVINDKGTNHGGDDATAGAALSMMIQ